VKKIIIILILFLTVSVFPQKFENLSPIPPMGWNSWNTFQTEVNEKLIKETADALIKNGMRDAGYNYIVIDDGWEAMDRDSSGNLIPDPNKFPHGMKALGDYLHKKGFKFGIHNCAGYTTCSGFPGGRGHEFQDAKMYVSWGVDYLKYDWCDHGTANAEETYTTMARALYAAGRPIVFSLCEWGDNQPWLWGSKIAQLWRTTGDITDCYDCQDVYALGWKFILDQQADLARYADPNNWNDPDMLEVGNKGLSFTESKAHFSLWCMMAAPLMAGNDVRNMSDGVRNILTNKEVIAIDQDILGKQATRFMQHPGKEIWAKELSNDEWAVCFFNSGNDEMEMRVNWSYLSFLNGKYSIRDLWLKKNIGTTDTNMNFNIPSHDVVLVKLTPIK